ncbi:Subtilase family protein [Actinoplanes philippinensis]|uniref:Subtilase family protein n=1 Tax=Actinoplanes philippinensis TaxID=35752 RepID=A0A1I2ABY6_9ACTN|nr:S8 family serine peptidase [Actinoplanes philippinensis]SFE41392.1 Subtilase family protein [Actinoplanes philippinensis]
MTDHNSAVPVGSRRERYLVAPLGAPHEADHLLARLGEDPATTVHRVVSTAPSFAVVEMDADRAAMLTASGAAHVEPDLPLRCASPMPDPSVSPSGGVARVPFLVTGSDGRPLEGAEIYLMNETFLLRGVTAQDGTVTIDAPAGVLHALDGVHVKPRQDYWAVWLGRPELTADAPNLVTCPSFAETFPGFPQRPLDGWARRAMRFDALPPTFRGDGIRIAIVDSGASVEHPDLAGRVVGERDQWEDPLGHGTHVAGIIGGADDGHGIVGVVPEAVLHSYRVLPDGRFSDLIEAIDRCIADNVDVINLSLGNAQPSPLVARRIEQARQAGIACVAAAGSSGGPVMFPASLPTVLAVAAIGRLGDYPPESYHATRVYGVPTVEGYFSASFTCHGPEIDVCAPGVAIVSSVPAAGYAAWDGTSCAAPYVTGLAALLLAHHPDFRGAARDSARVDHLFELIRGSCRPLPLGDPTRSGAGLPDAVAALGLVPPVTTSPPAHPILAELWTMMAQSGLIPVSVPTVAHAHFAQLPPPIPTHLPPPMATHLATPPAPHFSTSPAGPFPFGTSAGPPMTGPFATPAGSPLGGPFGASTGSPMGGSFAASTGSPTDFPTHFDGGEPAQDGDKNRPSRITLTAPAGEPLDPLRAAMRSAGLLPQTH